MEQQELSTERGLLILHCDHWGQRQAILLGKRFGAPLERPKDGCT